jgi:anti-anti-sigma factor
MSAPARIALEGELTIYRAAELRDQLMSALSQAPEGLEIDLSSVVELDSAGVQLLMAAKRAAGSTGRALALSGHSQAVVDVFELMDLAAFFGDPLVVGAPSSADQGHAR